MSITHDYSKQSQIIQNYFAKCAQLVAHARLSPDDIKPDNEQDSATQSTNKWFNLELAELDFLQPALRPWKQASLETLPPPLVLECYLDPAKLRPGQTIVSGDRKSHTNCEVVLERWVIECRAPTGGAPPDSETSEYLPALYKRAVVSVRAIYSILRLLPAWQLHQRLLRQKLVSVPLKIGVRVHDGSQPISSRGRVGLSRNPDGGKSSLQQYKAQPLVTPLGTLHCAVTYREDTRFMVEDIEQVMAHKFMALDAPDTNMLDSRVADPFNSAYPAAIPTHFVGSNNTAPSHSNAASCSPVGRPVLSFTRPFKSQDHSNARSTTLGTSPSQTVSSVVGSASSGISTASSRFSSSFASQRMAARPDAHRGSHGSYTSHNSYPSSSLGDPVAEISDFVKFVDETSRRSRLLPVKSDVDTTLARYQSMLPNHIHLSDSLINDSSQPASRDGSVDASLDLPANPEFIPVPNDSDSEQSANNLDTVKPQRPRGGGPRSRLGFYTEREDQDLLFALSDVHF